MFKTEIQLKLKQAGLRQEQVSRATGYHRITISNTLKGKQFCQPVQDYIARAIGVSPHEVWGQNYAPIRKAIKKAGK